MKKTKKNKFLTDSILLSKGLPQIERRLVPWRRNAYILLTLEIIVSILYFSLEIYFTITEDADNAYFIWVILSIVFDVLLGLYEWGILSNVEQTKLRCSLKLYYLILLNIIAASLTQSINQFLHPEDYLIEANLIFETLSLVCGGVILFLGIIRICIYHFIILRMDLKGKEKYLRKILSSGSKKGKKNILLQMELNREEAEEAKSISSIESFTYKLDKKSRNSSLA